MGDRDLGEIVRFFGEVFFDFFLDLGVVIVEVLGVGDIFLDFFFDLGVLEDLVGVIVGVFIFGFFLVGDFVIDIGVFLIVVGVFLGDCILDLGVVIVFDKFILGVEFLFGFLFKGVLFIFWGDEGGFCNGVSIFMFIFIYKKFEYFYNRIFFLNFELNYLC